MDNESKQYLQGLHHYINQKQIEHISKLNNSIHHFQLFFHLQVFRPSILLLFDQLTQ